MKNILSYTHNPILSGKEILAWVKYQLENNTSHYKMAKWIDSHFTIKENQNYKIYWKLEHEGYPDTNKPYFCSQDKIGKFYLS